MFDWWTFFFQLLNFFIVLYILYRLFFNPLRRIITQREETIGARLRALEEGEARLKADEAHYEEMMAEIGELRERELDAARKEALIEKDILMKEAGLEIKKTVEKQNGILEQERTKFEKEIKAKSLDFGLHYAENALKELSDEALHEKRIERFLEALPQKGAEEIALLKPELEGSPCEVTLTTPYMPPMETQQRIEHAVGGLLACERVLLHTVHDPSLIGGIRLNIRNKVFDASLKGELDRFRAQMEREL